MAEHNAVVGIYHSHTDAEAAVKALQRAEFAMQQLSIVGKDHHTEEHVIGYYNAGDRMQFWGTLGAFWGWLCGLLVGAALFVIPGLGPVIVFGPLVGALAGALGGAVVGGGLVHWAPRCTVLASPGIALWSTRRRSSLRKFLLMVHGTADEVALAKRILETTGAAHSPPMRG